MLIRRRTILAATAAMLARPAWAQQASPALVAAAKQEGTVVFYTSVDVAVAEKMTALFNAGFPDIKLRVERSGAERILQRLKPGRKPLSEIKLLLSDPTALARETEAIKQRYAQVFGV